MLTYLNQTMFLLFLMYTVSPEIVGKNNVYQVSQINVFNTYSMKQPDLYYFETIK